MTCQQVGAGEKKAKLDVAWICKASDFICTVNLIEIKSKRKIYP